MCYFYMLIFIFPIPDCYTALDCTKYALLSLSKSNVIYKELLTVQ